jgi:NitT/TauT family transport system ATP-binding protein
VFVSTTLSVYGAKAMTQSKYVKVDGLCVDFVDGDKSFTALHNVSVSVDSGEFVTLFGPSGCGKTTLLNVLGGFIRPTAGTVWIGGKHPTEKGFERGVVFQEFALFPWRTALGNVIFGLELRNVDKKKALDIGREQLALVGLQGFEDRYPHELSGGMKQRVAIARALAFDPDILLMDEPFGALDALTREQLQGLLVKVWEQTKKTVVYVTHSATEAIFLSERVYVFKKNPGEVKTIMPSSGS